MLSRLYTLFKPRVCWLKFISCCPVQSHIVSLTVSILNTTCLAETHEGLFFIYFFFLKLHEKNNLFDCDFDVLFLILAGAVEAVATEQEKSNQSIKLLNIYRNQRQLFACCVETFTEFPGGGVISNKSVIPEGLLISSRRRNSNRSSNLFVQPSADNNPNVNQKIYFSGLHYFTTWCIVSFGDV